MSATRSLAAEAAFRARVAELGGVVLEPKWLGTAMPHRVRCARGHECRPRPGGVGQGKKICRPCSRAAYVPYVDEVAVDRAVAGEPPERLTPRERDAAIRRLDARGLTAREIADRLGCCARTVHRVRAKVRRDAA